MSTLRMTRGDDETFPMALTRNAVAVDLTNATIKFTVKASLESGSPILLQKTELNGITVTNAVGGLLLVIIDEADTEDWDFNNFKKEYFWEIEVILGSGEKKTADSGLLVIKADLD